MADKFAQWWVSAAARPPLPNENGIFRQTKELFDAYESVKEYALLLEDYLDEAVELLGQNGPDPKVSLFVNRADQILRGKYAEKEEVGS